LALRQDLYRNYHSQSYLEKKKYTVGGEWNRRVLQPFRYNRNLYEMTINYKILIMAMRSIT
jgi:hypothetical protein